MKTNITAAEWKVMEVIWMRSPITAAEIEELLREQEQSWASNTVRTMLARLVSKGVLQYTQESNRYLYSPAISRDECVRDEVDSLLDRMFDGAAQSLLVHFVQNRKLTRKQIAQLRKILDDQEEGKP